MKRGNHSRSRGSKALVILLALVLVIGTVVGTTVAWLTDQTDPVINTFTVGNVDIKLEETKTEFKMIPGHTIEKDPKVTVVDGSEDCWLFVKLEKAITPEPSMQPVEDYTFDQFISYEMADGWISLTDSAGNEVPGVYYRPVMKIDETKEFSVLKGDKVTVSTEVTKAMMDKLTTEKNNPTLTVTAYACQYYSTNNTAFTPVAAWQTIQGS